jgi:DnaK suppressor protein
MKEKNDQKRKGSQETAGNSVVETVHGTQERYTDEELKEFKSLILSKLEEAIADFELLKGTLRLSGDHGTDDTSPTFKLLEDAADVVSKEETAQLASRQEKFIQHLQNALIRVENKSYGICRVTGKLIPKERLRSVPHATMSIDAKRENPGA